jgi:hypothetical protein
MMSEETDLSTERQSSGAAACYAEVDWPAHPWDLQRVIVIERLNDEEVKEHQAKYGEVESRIYRCGLPNGHPSAKGLPILESRLNFEHNYEVPAYKEAADHQFKS